MPSSNYVGLTFVSGEVPTTSIWNQLWTNDASFNTGVGFNDSIITTRHLATGIETAPVEENPYKFSVYLNGAQSSTNGTSKILFDTAQFDTSSNFDIVTNHQFTAPIAGFYQFNWRVTASTTTTSLWISYLQNTSGPLSLAVGSYGGSASSFASTAGAALIQLSANASVAVALQASGVDAITHGNIYNTKFEGFLVSAT